MSLELPTTPMNEQETFNYVSAFLIKQELPSRDQYDFCRYRVHTQEKILKCGIGCLIPDEVYSREIEGKTVWTLAKQFPSIHDAMPIRCGIGFLREIQTCHDSSAPRIESTSPSLYLYSLTKSLKSLAAGLGLQEPQILKDKFDELHGKT